MDSTFPSTPAVGSWHFKFDNNPEVNALKLYADIYNNGIFMKGTRWPNPNVHEGFDFQVHLVDRILGNGQLDLPPNGYYDFPNDRVKATYNGVEDGKNFHVEANRGYIQIHYDENSKMFTGKIITYFEVNGVIRQLASNYEIKRPVKHHQTS
jgi:hypothetical protein